MSIQRAMISTIKFFDFLSHSPQLRVNKKASYHTVFGGIISFIIGILTIVGIFYFGKELYFKNEPVAVISAKEYQDLDYRISPLEYSIYVAIEDNNYIYYNDPSIFTLSAYNDIITIDSSGAQNVTRKEVLIAPCSGFYKDNSELQNNQTLIDLNLFYCIEPYKTHIEGYWGSPINSYLGIVLSKCTNSTQSSQICKSEAEIDRKIEGGVLSVYSENHILDMNNYDAPVRRFFDDIFYSLNIDFTFTLFISLRPLEFISDGGFILRDEATLFTSYADDPHILYYGKREDIIAEVIVQAKPLGKSVNRTYTKFQDVLTKVGGLIKAFTVIGYFLIKFTSEVEFVNDYMYTIRSRDKGTETQIKNIENIKNNFVGKNSNLPLEIPLKKSKKKALDIDSINSRSNNIVLDNLSSKSPQIIYSCNREESLKVMPISLLINGEHSTVRAFRDFINHGFCFGRKTQSKRLFDTISSKIDHALSIETLLEEIYMIEALCHATLTKERRDLLVRDFVKVLMNSSCESDCMKVFQFK